MIRRGSASGNYRDVTHFELRADYNDAMHPFPRLCKQNAALGTVVLVGYAVIGSILWKLRRDKH